MKTHASIRNAKLYRLARLQEHLAELKARLAGLERGEVFAPDAVTPSGRKAGKVGADSAAKPKGKAAKAPKPPKEAKAVKRRSRVDTDDDGESDEDFVAVPARLSSRGRILKRTTQPNRRPAVEEDEDAAALALAMEMSMHDS